MKLNMCGFVFILMLDFGFSLICRSKSSKPVRFGPDQYCCKGKVFDRHRNDTIYSCCNNKHYDVERFTCDRINHTLIPKNVSTQSLEPGNSLNLKLHLSEMPGKGKYRILSGNILLYILKNGHVINKT